MRAPLLGEVLCRSQPARYYLLVDELEGEKELYGVGVTYRGETARFPGLTLSQRAVQELLSAMMGGCVTPASASAVVDDWLLR